MRKQQLPLPFCGVILGIAALGNLLQSYSQRLRFLCGVFAVLFLIFMVMQILQNPGAFAEEMREPATASVFGTFPMSLMLLSGYAKDFLGGRAVLLWYAGIVLHITLILWFTCHFMMPPHLPQIFASYFIVYVGIAAGCICAMAFHQQFIGTCLFWLAFSSMLLLMVLITIRYIKVRKIPEKAKPLFCIYTAPVSLCLTGYLQIYPEKNVYLVSGMAAAGLVLYLIVLSKLLAYLRLPFYPSYSAFTFPFVISAVSMKQTALWLAQNGIAVPGLSVLVLLQTGIAAFLVCYTLLRYFMAYLEN